MPHYHKLGAIPPKRHIQFRKPDGKLYAEQLVSTEGFSAEYSLVYHCYPPTMVRKIDEPVSVVPEIVLEKNMQHRSFQGFKVKPVAGYIQSRVPVLVNSDCYIYLAAPTSWQPAAGSGQSDFFFKNSDGDELIFVHEGEGVLKTMYGQIEFGYGDHLVIPRGVIYQLEFKSANNRLFIVESFGPFRFPTKYVNQHGPLL